MGRVYLVRHGQVELNRANAYIGSTDLPLDETGRKQAEQIADRLEDKGITAIYSSDLSRARESAEILAERLGFSIILMPELRELDYGEWEGVPEVELPKRYPDIHSRWLENPVDVRVPGGETAGELRDRAYPAFLRITEAHVHDNVLVVAHKSTNRIILACLLEMDLNRYRQIGQGNAAINVIEIRENGWLVVEQMNERCHLRSG